VLFRTAADPFSSVARCTMMLKGDSAFIGFFIQQRACQTSVIGKPATTHDGAVRNLRAV